MKNYSKTELGTMDAVANMENGKAFLHDTLGLTSCEISVNSMPAGVKVPFNHNHIQNEEVYIILSGTGVMTIDSEDIALTAGTTVRIAPSAVRTMANTGNAPLTYICVQARENSLNQFGLGDGQIC